MNSVLEDIAKNLAPPAAPAVVEPPVQAPPVTRPVAPPVTPPAAPVNVTPPAAPEAPATPQVDPEVQKHLNWLVDETAVDAPVTPSATPSITPPEPRVISDDEKLAQEILKDPLGKALLEFRKSGKPLSEFTKELQQKDFNGKSDLDIYTDEIKKYGQLSEDETAAEIEKFNALPILQKKQLINEIKGGYEKSFSEKLAQYQPKDNSEFVIQAQKAAAKELDETVKSMAGKYFYGLQITPEISEEITSYVVKNARPKPDGTGYDIPASIREAVFFNDKLVKKLLKATADMATAQGYDKLIAERNRPDKELSPGIVPSTKLGISDAISDMIEKRRQ